MKKEDLYQTFLRQAREMIPADRIYTDELRRLTWGTDAGFYRLTPRLVVRSKDEGEVSGLLRLASRLELPVTFRAAGTSLSGQAVGEGILIVAGKHWEQYRISHNGEVVALQPGIVGERVNQLLEPYGRCFAPDPASVKSSMVGGIVINNASGMSCGTHANSDRVMLSARMVLADGTVLDTSDERSRASFTATHADLLAGIVRLRDRITGDAALVERIRYKYSIKNVVGLNLLPFITYPDPFDIIAHLLVGSEGTLAFLSEVTMKTLEVLPCKASAMIYFGGLRQASEAVLALRGMEHSAETVTAAEMLDYKSLSSVDDAVYLQHRGETTALLVETQARTPGELQAHIQAITRALDTHQTVVPIRFTDRVQEYAPYWAIRSGIFPAVGGTRPPGTTCLIEDVCFHIDDLPEATVDMQQLLAAHGYTDACIYGHALEGNYHFILNQSFADPSEVARYEALMEDVKHLVVDKYDGSLKAEHGTGRNMAPFVAYEWGEQAFGIMKQIKELFDPKGLLNPGVIFNDDPTCHIKHLKPLPLLSFEEANEADKCIECGFCEVNCLSCGFTLSARGRIVAWREISRLRRSQDDPERLALLEKQYRYQGNATCAGDGLCATSCPMGIDTGDLTHLIRQESLPQGSAGYRTGDFAARHFAGVKGALRPLLGLADAAHSVLGTRAMTGITHSLHRVLGVPQWSQAMPKAYHLSKQRVAAHSVSSSPLQVVYFPSCINQTMGLPKHSPVKEPLVDKMLALLQKAGYEVLFPQGMEKLCCGTIWESKGMPDIADGKSRELEEALWQASDRGRIPVLCDQSPCLHRMRQTIGRMKLYEPAEFIETFLVDKLRFTPTDRRVALHITCSMRKMGLAEVIVRLAKRCSTRVFVPAEVGCCGFAGDKGFTQPELNAYALRKLRPQIQEEEIAVGYSNSRTCEIGLMFNSGIPYVSIAYLVDECTTPVTTQKQ
ncbi:MAG: FAD-binding oxidoreductase [Prevotellaceae bacterium]|jgi:D-lactate dehydrogenase|nr:FAD-binding oxidoreductase [Prevotellaceae bacterium]